MFLTKQNKTKQNKTIAILAFSIFASNSFAAQVTPVSYKFDKATGGYAPWGITYSDSTGKELTDGQVGFAGWLGQSLANNNVQPWVGWENPGTVNIDFDFGKKVSVDKIEIGSTKVLTDLMDVPTIALFSSNNGSTWTSISATSSSNFVNVDRYNTTAHSFITLNNLVINSQFIRVAATQTNKWTFLDEVKFSSSQNTTATPVPAAVWLFGSGLAGLIATHRKNKFVA